MGRAGDPLVRQQLADVIVHERVARYTNLRAMATVAAGRLPGPEMSIAKLSLTDQHGPDLRGRRGDPRAALVADTGAWGTYAWSQYVLGVPGMRIAGGTDEVMHNIIGERVLGLPKEPTPPELGTPQTFGGRPRAQRNAMPSTNAHDRRWIEVSPNPASAVRWTRDG